MCSRLVGPRSYSKELWRRRQNSGIYGGKGWTSHVAPVGAVSPNGAIDMGVSKSILNTVVVKKKSSIWVELRGTPPKIDFQTQLLRQVRHPQFYLQNGILPRRCTGLFASDHHTVYITIGLQNSKYRKSSSNQLIINGYDRLLTLII